MSLRKYGNQRDANEQEIIDALEAAHCSVERMNVPADLLVGRMTRQGPRCYLLEVKSKKGKHTPDQVDFITEWRGQYDVVRSVDQALKAVGINP